MKETKTERRREDAEKRESISGVAREFMKRVKDSIPDLDGKGFQESG